MKQGTLYIIAGPIGNLEDITIRALNIMKEKIDCIYCEDTRQTRKLLNHYKIELPAYSLHAHSNDAKINSAVKMLEDGKSIAYLTDSGTPGISDPGAGFVRAARAKNIPIVPLPGPSALTSLISVSGFPGKNIVFMGFLSKKDSKIKKELLKYKDFNGILIIYESPYRIKKLLIIIHELFPDSEIIIGREMTKIYEEFISGNMQEIHTKIDNIHELGEFCIGIFTGKS